MTEPVVPAGADVGADVEANVEADVEADDYVVQRARQALAHDPHVAELGVRVRAVGDTLELSGQVATPERQAAVAEVVRRAVPDHDVDNQVTVAPFAEGPGMERLP